MNTRTKQSHSLIIMGGLLLILFSVSLVLGPVGISWQEIISTILSGLKGNWQTSDGINSGMVFWYVRLPRCLLTIFVGAGLAVSGAVYQGLFRNPLVSPDILGVSAGATFGAALGLLLPGTTFMLIHILAFAFGILAVSMALAIARLVAVKPLLVLVLAGLIVLSVFNSAITIAKFMADPYNELPAIIFWIMGSMSRASWQDVWVVGLITTAGLAFFHVSRYKLNILSLGDTQAKSLGLKPQLYRLVFIAVSSLLVAITVSVCGQICWIGLVIPHIARTMVGPNHEVMLPITMVTGALFLTIADLLARTMSTAEIPISVVTAFIGAPMFAILLYKNRASGWL